MSENTDITVLTAYHIQSRIVIEKSKGPAAYPRCERLYKN